MRRILLDLFLGARIWPTSSDAITKTTHDSLLLINPAAESEVWISGNDSLSLGLSPGPLQSRSRTSTGHGRICKYPLVFGQFRSRSNQSDIRSTSCKTAERYERGHCSLIGYRYTRVIEYSHSCGTWYMVDLAFVTRPSPTFNLVIEIFRHLYSFFL